MVRHGRIHHGPRRDHRDAANAADPILRQPLAPSIVGASLEVFRMLDETTELRDRLEENTRYFKAWRIGLTSRMEKVPLSWPRWATRD